MVAIKRDKQFVYLLTLRLYVVRFHLNFPFVNMIHLVVHFHSLFTHAQHFFSYLAYLAQVVFKGDFLARYFNTYIPHIYIYT